MTKRNKENLVKPRDFVSVAYAPKKRTDSEGRVSLGVVTGEVSKETHLVSVKWWNTTDKRRKDSYSKVNIAYISKVHKGLDAVASLLNGRRVPDVHFETTDIQPVAKVEQPTAANLSVCVSSKQGRHQPPHSVKDPSTANTLNQSPDISKTFSLAGLQRSAPANVWLPHCQLNNGTFVMLRGNSCFLDVIILTILCALNRYWPDFYEYIAETGYEHAEMRKPLQTTSFIPVRELLTLLHNILNSNSQQKIRNAIDAYRKTLFSEFLTPTTYGSPDTMGYALDMLEVFRPAFVASFQVSRQLPVLSRQNFLDYTSIHNNIPNPLTSLVFEERRECCSCDSERVKVKTSSFVMVNMCSSTNVRSMLKEFAKASQKKCKHCQTDDSVQIRKEFIGFPILLTIEMRSSFHYKNVNFEIEKEIDVFGNRYHLLSILLHESLHYTTLLSQKTGHWVYYDPFSANVVPAKPVLKCQTKDVYSVMYVLHEK